ncbi:MAG TPA: hypothetical protein ENI87_12740 [bacterium]|nr:hypothetical protein [bacterium]
MTTKRLPRGLALLLLPVAGCIGKRLPPSVWPPPNFLLVVEETELDGGSVHVVRRFRVDARGLVVYGTSLRPLVDKATGTSLPVFDRLSIYRLEPKCVRGLARRLDRLDIPEIVVEELPANGTGVGLTISYRAFAADVILPAAGRLRGEVAEIVALVTEHLPPGEQFGIGVNRAIKPVLRGVPMPATGAAPALAAYRALIAEAGDEADPDLVLDAFALACRIGARAVAEHLLDRWQALMAGRRRSGFEDDPSAAPTLRAELLRTFLPPGG